MCLAAPVSLEKALRWQSDLWRKPLLTQVQQLLKRQWFKPVERPTVSSLAQGTNYKCSKRLSTGTCGHGGLEVLHETHNCSLCVLPISYSKVHV